MKQGYRVVDADAHVIEPADLWDRYLDPAIRDGSVPGPVASRPCAETVKVRDLRPCPHPSELGTLP